MPVLQPDTSQIDEAIAPGTYKAKIISVDAQTSKKGNPMIVPKFEIDVSGKRRVRQAYVVVAGDAAFNFDQLLRACKLGELADKYKDKSLHPKPPFDTDVLVGQELQVVMDEQIYEGQKRDTVKSYLPA